MHVHAPFNSTSVKQEPYANIHVYTGMMYKAHQVLILAILDFGHAPTCCFFWNPSNLTVCAVTSSVVRALLCRVEMHRPRLMPGFQERDMFSAAFKCFGSKLFGR